MLFSDISVRASVDTRDQISQEATGVVIKTDDSSHKMCSTHSSSVCHGPKLPRAARTLKLGHTTLIPNKIITLTGGGHCPPLPRVSMTRHTHHGARSTVPDVHLHPLPPQGPTLTRGSQTVNTGHQEATKEIPDPPHLATPCLAAPLRARHGTGAPPRPTPTVPDAQWPRQ